MRCHYYINNFVRHYQPLMKVVTESNHIYQNTLAFSEADILEVVKNCMSPKMDLRRWSKIARVIK